jgi:serine/threonine protein kinase
MIKVARLLDDLRAARRSDMAFDSLSGRISAHLVAAPDAATEVLQQLQSAYDQNIIEPEQFTRLKSVVDNTIASRSGGSRPASLGGAISRSNIAVGTRLRERFILDEVLGAGGMGTVYKGRDLLKVEARDRNPYVAIKVLNDDFKKRDDAFIVLQREASRQQRLAHPNIVTVYDFDRTGDIVFISMELLEGTPLDEYLKSHARPRSGLPLRDALPLIEGMCAALTHAHERGIVHADFKPSNSFVLADGSIKVLDFGIARAMKKPNQTGGDLTVFDGRSLGAMTPAYASPEMLEESGDPDARDDVYALACVCYELLTGWHPFNRASATDARDQKLVPKRIAGLNARQNRALARALAFERHARTSSVRDFIAELKPDDGNRLRLSSTSVGVIAALLLLIAVGGFWYSTRYPVTRAIADLQSGNRQTAQAAIERLAELSPADRADVLQTAKPAIIEHFRAQVQAMLDSGEIDIASAKADVMLRSGLVMYPDATELANLQAEVAKRKERYLSELAEQYETYLAAGRLLRSKQHGDIQGVMQRIQLIDPKHPLLSDPRVPGAFANAASVAIDSGKLDVASALLADGKRLAPNDGVLRDVADKLASAEQQARLVQRTNELASSIDSKLNSLSTLSALAPLSDELVELHQIAANHPVLNHVRAAIRPLLGKDYQLITNVSTIDGIVTMERNYLAALEAVGLHEALGLIRDRREALTARRDRLLAQARELAATPGAKTKEGVAIGRVIAELRELAPADPELAAVITAAAAEQRRVAQRLSAEHEWQAARNALAAALALDDSVDMKALVAQDLERVAQRESDALRESAEAERVLARTVERMKVDQAQSQLQAALNGFVATPAGLATLRPRIAALAALDPGNAMIQSARDTAAQRIAAAANTAAQAGQFDTARDLLAKAAVDLPGVAAIAAARTQLDTLQAEAARRAENQLIAAAQQKFRSVLEQAVPTDERWQREADTALAAVQRTSSANATAARQQLAAKYLQAAAQLGDEKRFTIASQMLAKAEALTPKDATVQLRREQLAQAAERVKTQRAVEELAAKVNATKQRFGHEINARQFERARKTLAELQSINPNDAFTTREAPMQLANGYLAAAQALLKSGDYAAAVQLARSGAAMTPGDARFAQLRADADAAASKRIETLLVAPGNIDKNALVGLIAQYKSALPERYQALSPTWVTRIKGRLAELSTEPVRHNTYLSAVQSAFQDLPTVQAIRPVEIKVAAGEPRSSVMPGDNNGGVSTPPVSTPVTAAPVASPTVTPASAAMATTNAPVAPINNAATAPEPTLIGKWCGDDLGLNFTPSSYAFELKGGRTIQYGVERYQRVENTISMSWTDKALGSMVTEFGDFSADGQSMVQVRGKTANSTDWKSYNRRFKRCK